MTSAEEAGTKRGQHRGLRILVGLCLAVCVIAVGASVFFYQKYRQSQNSEQVVRAKLLHTLGASIELPNETPTIVTVADKDKLANKSLAAKLQNNDLLLVFGQAKRLVIYRPSNKKVVDMLSFKNSNELPQDTADKQ